MPSSKSDKGEKSKERKESSPSSGPSDQPGDLSTQMSTLPKIPKLVVKTGPSAEGAKLDQMVDTMKEQGETMKMLVGTLTKFMESSVQAAASTGQASIAKPKKRRAPDTLEVPEEADDFDEEVYDEDDDSYDEAFSADVEETEEEPSLLETFGSGQASNVPSDFQLKLWGKVMFVCLML